MKNTESISAAIHPSKLTDEARAKLAADLEAEESHGDPDDDVELDDDGNPIEKDDPADDELDALTEKEAAAGAAGAGAAGAGATGAPAAAADPAAAGATGAVAGATGPTGATGSAEPTAADAARVPKARLDEVIAQRDKAREDAAAARDELARQQAAAAAAAAANQTRDFDAEAKAIEDKYDAGDIDQHEYNRAMRKIGAEQAADAAAQATIRAQAQVLEQKVAQGWDAEYAAFASEHAEFHKLDGAVAAMQAAVKGVEAKYAAMGEPAPDDATLIEEASAIAFRKVGYTPPAPVVQREEPRPGETLKQRRQREAAQAATAAAAGTPPTPVGRGNRNDTGKVDYRSIKPGTLSKNLSKDQLEAELGGPGSL